MKYIILCTIYYKYLETMTKLTMFLGEQSVTLDYAGTYIGSIEYFKW